MQCLGNRVCETKALGWHVHAKAVLPFADGENDGEYVELIGFHKVDWLIGKVAGAGAKGSRPAPCETGRSCYADQTRGSVLLREHDGEHALGEARVCRIG
jgi:hypothetical protein